MKLSQADVRAAWFAKNVSDGKFTGSWLLVDAELNEQGQQVLLHCDLVTTREFVHHDTEHNEYLGLRQQVEGLDSDVALVSCWIPGAFNVLAALKLKNTDEARQWLITRPNSRSSRRRSARLFSQCTPRG